MTESGPIRGWIIRIERYLPDRGNEQTVAVGIPDQAAALAAVRNDVGGDYPLTAVTSFDEKFSEYHKVGDGDIKPTGWIRTKKIQ